jgi:hypothetical protein
MFRLPGPFKLERRQGARAAAVVLLTLALAVRMLDRRSARVTKNPLGIIARRLLRVIFDGFAMLAHGPLVP